MTWHVFFGFLVKTPAMQMTVPAIKNVDWKKIADQFPYDRKFVHLGASQFMVAHPFHVQKAIEHYGAGSMRACSLYADALAL